MTSPITSKKIRVQGVSGRIYSGFVRKDESVAQAKVRILIAADDFSVRTLSLVRKANIRRDNVSARSLLGAEPFDNSAALQRTAKRRAANRASGAV